jgi:hypothetical protein
MYAGRAGRATRRRPAAAGGPRRRPAAAGGPRRAAPGGGPARWDNSCIGIHSCIGITQSFATQQATQEGLQEALQGGKMCIELLP